MIAIVCGGRDYGVFVPDKDTNPIAERARVKQILDAAVERLGLDTIIEGGATGADRLAREWAVERGDVSWIEVPADWDKGRGAGAARNQMMMTMLLRSDDDKAVIAFPGGVGTEHMCKLADRNKVRLIRA